jgi:hypothetical protein
MITAPRIKKSLDLVLVGTFVLMLSLPTIYSLCRFQKNKSIDEHRRFADFPGFSSDASLLQLYGKDLENYYDDHFGCRELLIACNLMIDRALFREVGGKVLVGHDGWLYFLGENMINNFLGNTKLPPGRLKDQQDKLEKRRDLLAARGIKYLIVIAPNKESAYPQYLPAWLRQSATTTKTDQFVNYMRLHSTVEVLDLRLVLRKAGEREPVFYKIDTHWNLMGGFIAYEAVLSKLSGQIPGLVPAALTNFDIQRTHGTGGDIARFAGAPALTDDNFYTFTPRAQLPMQKFYYLDTNQINWLRFGNLPVPEPMILTTTNSQCAGCIIVFGDSFAFALAPFLGCHFGKVSVLNQNFNLGDIDQNKPILVIDERVERFFIQ